MRSTQTGQPLAQVHTCEHGQMCAVEAPGHALSLIRARVASATASKWQDVIVQSRNADGTLVLSPLFGGADIVVWHHDDLRGTVSIGEPASLHGVYGVLATGRARYNVAAISIAAS